MVAAKDLNFGVPKSFDVQSNNVESPSDKIFELKIHDSYDTS